MNFKGFLKKTGFLNEDGAADPEAIKKFKQNAYKRVFKYRGSKANETDPDRCWRAVLNKARYKLTQNSNDDNRNAVKLAKGAITTAKARFKDAISDKLTADEEKEFAKNTIDKIKNHAEDWDIQDVYDLRKKLKERASGLFDDEFIEHNITLPELKGQANADFFENLTQEQQTELFEAMKDLEKEVEDEKVWKDKTIEDIDSIEPEDLAKIKAELAKKGIEITDKKDIEKLIKDGKLSPDDIEALDKLLEPEKTPANQDPPATPNGTTPPETENRDKQTQMQEMEKKRKLEKKLKDNDIPVKEDGTPDFDNPKTLEKINELMINGDDELYNEYILTKGGTQSDLAKMITDRQAKENELARTDLENRMARREAEKDQQKAICNVALALDIFMAFFSGKVQDGFSTLANKRVQAAALSKQFDEGMNKKAFAEEDQKIEDAHNAELDSIKTWETQKLQEIEQDRQTPMGTQAYKRKYGELVQEYNKKKAEYQEKGKKIDQDEKVQANIKNLRRALLTDTEITADNQELQAIYPIEANETPEAYTERLNNIIQSDTFDQDLEKKENEIQTEIENFNAEVENLEKDFDKAAKDLENDPDVQSEFKDANAAYEFKKANIQAEMNVLRAKEQKRYEDRKSVNKQVFDERRRVLKNIATMGQWSSDPMSVFATEMQAFNKRAKSLYESRGIPWNEGNDPLMSDDPDVLKQAMEDYKKRMEQGQQQQQQQGKGKGKKDDETGSQRPLGGQRPPLGGHKPGETGEGGEGGKAQNTGDGKKQLTQLQTEFGQKPKAKKRLEAFLKEKGLNPDDPDVNDDEIKNAIKEFKTKQFPEPANLTGQELKNLGITDADIPDDLKTTNGITDLGKYAEYLKDSKNATALKKLKEELGFEDTGKVTDTKPIKVPTDLAGIKKLKLGPVKIGDETKDLDNISDVDFEALKVKPEFQEFLKSVKFLSAISKGKTDSEKQEIEQVQDKDDVTPNTNKISEMSLKTLWNKLNNAGISIRSLPEYKPGMEELDKKKIIADYIKSHKQEFTDWQTLNDSVNLNHRKTAFKRLNEMSQAQKRASDRRTLRKFSELLVKDFRDFT